MTKSIVTVIRSGASVLQETHRDFRLLGKSWHKNRLITPFQESTPSNATLEDFQYSLDLHQDSDRDVSCLVQKQLAAIETSFQTVQKPENRIQEKPCGET